MHPSDQPNRSVVTSVVSISPHITHQTQDADKESSRSSDIPNGSTLARMIGIAAGIIVLAGSADPLAALAICLTFWLGGMIARWPLTMLQAQQFFPRDGLKFLWELHLWVMALLMFLMIWRDQVMVFSVELWLLLVVVGYHLTRVLRQLL